MHQATLSYIKSKGDATLPDIVRFIKETVSGVGDGQAGSAGLVCCVLL